MAEVLICDQCDTLIDDRHFRIERDSRTGIPVSTLTEQMEFHIHYDCVKDWGEAIHDQRQARDYKRGGTVRGKRPRS